MSAAALPWPAKAAAMRAAPEPAGGPCGDAGRDSAVTGCSAPGKDLGEVLVTAPAQADQVEVAGSLLEHPGHGMGALERRDDPLDRRQLVEGSDRLLVGDRLVAGAAAVAQVRVLGPAARVVEAGRDRVRLRDLAVVV